jgi:hypothetical protein
MATQRLEVPAKTSKDSVREKEPIDNVFGAVRWPSFNSETSNLDFDRATIMCHHQSFLRAKRADDLISEGTASLRQKFPLDTIS